MESQGEKKDTGDEGVVVEQIGADEGGKLNVSVQDENDVMMDKEISNEKQELSLKTASSTERNLYPCKIVFCITKQTNQRT